MSSITIAMFVAILAAFWCGFLVGRKYSRAERPLRDTLAPPPLKQSQRFADNGEQVAGAVKAAVQSVVVPLYESLMFRLEHQGKPAPLATQDTVASPPALAPPNTGSLDRRPDQVSMEEVRILEEEQVDRDRSRTVIGHLRGSWLANGVFGVKRLKIDGRLGRRTIFRIAKRLSLTDAVSKEVGTDSRETIHLRLDFEFSSTAGVSLDDSVRDEVILDREVEVLPSAVAANVKIIRFEEREGGAILNVQASGQ